MSTPTNIPETPMGETEQDSFFESKEKLQKQLQDIFQTTLKLTRMDHFDQLCQWMEYKQYLTIDDFYHSSYNDPEKFDTRGPATEYKWKGKMNYLSPIVAQKLKCFVRWMTHEDRPCELHDDFLATLTRDNYLKFRHMDSLSFSASSPHHHEPYKHKVKKEPQRKAFFPQQEETSDDDEYASGEEQFSTDPEPEEHSPYSVYQSSSQDEPTEEPPHDTSTQTLVNKCLAESGIDPDLKIQTHQRYVFARVNQSNHQLIDRGANGGLAGADMRVIHTTPRKINIVGIDDHELTGLNVVTAATLLDTQKGPIIGVFHEYAHLGKGRSIHAAGQMEWFNCQVDDRSKIVGGAQRIETSEGYVIPLSIESGLVYMHSIRIPSDQDLQNYPHVFFTSPDIWDASVLDHEITPSLLEDINQHSDDSLLQDSIFDEYGDLHHRAIQTLNIFCDIPSLPPGEPITHAHLHDSNSAEEDWTSLRPYFGWQSEQVMKDTYQVTSRFGGTIQQHDYLKKHFKSRNPVFNIPRRNEPVATDTIFSDTPAINDGSTMAQFFVGRDTLVCDAYGIKSQKQFINTLYDNIRYRGAMTTLITDGGRYEISKKVADLLRSLFIKQYESEPYHQHQNKAEQRYGVVKRYINTLMNLTGAPAHCWLLCMLYVCNLLNATVSPALGGLTPLQALTGQVPDISHFLHFSFWEPIYYKVDESEPDHRFPSQSNEKRGHWVGFADNKGDHLTWKILTDDTNTIIIRSAVRSATKTSPNLRLDPPKGEDHPQDLTSDVFVYGRPNPDGSDNTPPMSIIKFDDLLGRTFLLPLDENGERKSATISEHVKDLYQQQVSREDQLRFKLKIDGDQLDDLISYNQLMEYLEDKTDTGPLDNGLYRFKCIKDHKGPYTSDTIPTRNG